MAHSYSGAKGPGAFPTPVSSKDMRLETVEQVDDDQEDKIRMVTLCNVVK